VIELADVNGLVVTGTGRAMHLARVSYLGYFQSYTRARTLCGRTIYEVHVYPLAEEASLPWELCRPCSKKRSST
jgi:hypothetical protein